MTISQTLDTTIATKNLIAALELVQGYLNEGRAEIAGLQLTDAIAEAKALRERFRIQPD